MLAAVHGLGATEIMKAAPSPPHPGNLIRTNQSQQRLHTPAHHVDHRVHRVICIPLLTPEQCSVRGLRPAGEVCEGGAPQGSRLRGRDDSRGGRLKRGRHSPNSEQSPFNMAAQEPKRWWAVTGIAGNKWIAPRCTWGDIQRAVSALNEAPGGETFAPLHRWEGGFMCLSGPGGFASDEPATGCPAQPRASWSRKAIRFLGRQSGRLVGFRADWPSHNYEFSRATPDMVVFRGGEIISLEFEGLDCPRWTKKRCVELMEVVSKALGLEPARLRTGRRSGRERASGGAAL